MMTNSTLLPFRLVELQDMPLGRLEEVEVEDLVRGKILQRV